MMEDLVHYCLFCRDKIIPYSLSSQDDEHTVHNNLPSFPELCNVLGIKFTDDDLKQLKNVPRFCTNSNSNDNCETCEKFLCLCCFEMVDTLTKLVNEAKEIQQKIRNIADKIRSVIITRPSLTVTDTTPRRRGRPKKGYNSLDFVEAFQILVKESEHFINSTNADNEKSEDPSKSISLAAKQLRKKAKSLKNDEENVNVIPVSSHADVDDASIVIEEVKIEIEDQIGGNVMQDLNDYEHFADALITEELVQTVDEQKEDICSVQEIVQQSMDCVAKEEIVVTTEEPSTSPLVKRSRRKRSNPISANESESLAPPVRKKRKRKSTLAAQDQNLTCHYCKAVFQSHSKYYAHRKTHAPLSVKSLDITTYYEIENEKRVIIRVCSVCDHKVKGGHLALFMEHMVSHESTADLSSPLHSCDMCDKQFMLKLNLDLHKICQHDWNHVILKCELCGDYSCKSQDELVAHLKSHGSEATIHCCKSCPMACTSLDKLLTHMVKHSSSKRLFCPECSWFVSISLKELYQHCQQAHPELKETFKCDHCKKSFLMPGSLRNHLKQTHGIGDDTYFGNFVCSQCNNEKVYKTKASLERHVMYMHGDEESKRHKCDQCEKSFTYKSHLQQHVEDKHEKIRYPCPHCPKSYTERIQLNYHMRIHTGEGLYTCDTCGKQFPRLQQLKIHSIVHLEKSEQTKCVCEVCGKEFGNVLHLRKHKNSHKEKKLKCQYCDMLFRRPDHLRGHLRTHTGERPFVCPVCSKGFNRRDILIVHMRMHGYTQEEAAKAYDKHVEHLKQENLVS